MNQLYKIACAHTYKVKLAPLTTTISPKFLTDSDVDNTSGWRFGGGLAYLFDTNSGEQLLTSAYETNSSHSHPRVFGIGHGKATVTRGGLSMHHTVAVLPGDQPAVLIEVEVCVCMCV